MRWRFVAVAVGISLFIFTLICAIMGGLGLAVAALGRERTGMLVYAFLLVGFLSLVGWGLAGAVLGFAKGP